MINKYCADLFGRKVLVPKGGKFKVSSNEILMENHFNEICFDSPIHTLQKILYQKTNGIEIIY